MHWPVVPELSSPRIWTAQGPRRVECTLIQARSVLIEAAQAMTAALCWRSGCVLKAQRTVVVSQGTTSSKK
jgi:hypothetical protein